MGVLLFPSHHRCSWGCKPLQEGREHATPDACRLMVAEVTRVAAVGMMKIRIGHRVMTIRTFPRRPVLGVQGIHQGEMGAEAVTGMEIRGAVHHRVMRRSLRGVDHQAVVIHPVQTRHRVGLLLALWLSLMASLDLHGSWMNPPPIPSEN